MEKENGHDAHDHKCPHAVAGLFGGGKHAVKKDEVEGQRSKNADQSEIFRDNRENEIGLFFRDVIQIRLGCLYEEPFAENLSGSHCDLGLKNLISGAFGIDGRVDKSEKPVLLVRLK